MPPEFSEQVFFWFLNKKNWWNREKYWNQLTIHLIVELKHWTNRNCDSLRIWNWHPSRGVNYVIKYESFSLLRYKASFSEQMKILYFQNSGLNTKMWKKTTWCSHQSKALLWISSLLNSLIDELFRLSVLLVLLNGNINTLSMNDLNDKNINHKSIRKEIKFEKSLKSFVS